MQNLTENGCWRQTITQGQAEKIITADVLEIKTLSETSLLYLAKVHDTTNIFSANPNSRSTSALTDLAAPNLVNSFQLDPAAKTVVYEVRNEALRNIYASNRDGGNRIQLTNDNQSQSPVISPNGLSVAYLKPGDGIYVSSIDKLTNQKITNLAEIARLLVWR